MRLVFAGTPQTALASLEALIASSHDVVAVVTRPDAPAGRGRVLTESPVAARAKEHGIAVLTPTQPSDPTFLAQLAELEPDCCPVVAYGGLLPKAALEIPSRGWINLHFSILPAWRGAAPVQHAILHGDDVTGATTFLLDEGLDTGPVLGVVTESIRSTDTSGELLARLSQTGAHLLVSTLDAMAVGALVPVAQSGDGVSHAPKLTTADARIDWTQPAFGIDRKIRACTPEPGTWTMFRGERLGVGPVRVELLTDQTPSIAPGEVVAEKSRVLIGTATAPVVLGEVKPAGKKHMSAADWARGVRIEQGELVN
jgi:methionyl-tRNA formyltransferase